MTVLEDAGFYCVDNMPVELLPKFLEMPFETTDDFPGVAFVMDLREKGFLEKHSDIFNNLKQNAYNITMLFLESDEKVLLQRYSETRRHHPLSHGKSLIDNIRYEKTQLKRLRDKADYIIDSSAYNVHELKSKINGITEKITMRSKLRINIVSFGFKYSAPADADLIMDVRFLANPYFIPELKPLDGEANQIRDFVLNHETTGVFLQKFTDLLDYLLPLYKKEGKAYLTIAIGCTGGRHRSVVIAKHIFDHIGKTEKQIEILHRDINR